MLKRRHADVGLMTDCRFRQTHGEGPGVFFTQRTDQPKSVGAKVMNFAFIVRERQGKARPRQMIIQLVDFCQRLLQKN